MGALVGCAEDNKQEEGGEDDFGDEAGEQVVTAGGVLGVAVGSEAAGEREAGFAAGDDIENARCGEAAQDLSDNVGAEFGDGEALADDEADGDGRVEMAAGDVSDSEGHGKERQTKGESDSDEAYAQLWVSGGNNGASAASEDKPEGAEELGCCTF